MQDLRVVETAVFFLPGRSRDMALVIASVAADFEDSADTAGALPNASAAM